MSVVIAAFQAETTPRAAISSVLTQTHRSFEVLVVDEGSTDHTHQVAEAHDDQVRPTTIR